MIVIGEARVSVEGEGPELVDRAADSLLCTVHTLPGDTLGPAPAPHLQTPLYVQISAR